MAAISDAARDTDLLQHIARYCDDAMDAVHAAGSETVFLKNRLYQHAVAMCILEIGELAKRISDEFVEKHPEIPWRSVRRMRDMYAHHYHKTDPHQLWTTAVIDLPALKAFCEHI